MKKQEDKINWFGIQQQQVIKRKFRGKPKYNSNAISYLGLGPKKTSQKVNYFGFGQKNKYKMTPSSMFRKESIKKKRLSKWGDADMDGSPNCRDCDPLNFMKDYKVDKNGNRPPIDAQGYIDNTRKPKMGSREEQNAILAETKTRMREGRRAKRKESIQSLREGGKSYIKSFKREKPYSALSEEKRKAKELIKGRQRQREEYASLRTKGKISEEDYSSAIQDINEEEQKEKLRGERVSSIEARSMKIKELMKAPGLAGSLASARFAVEEKIAAGKKPSKKELAALAKVERRARPIGDIQQEGKLSRELLTRIPGGELGRIATGAAVEKGGEYSRAVKAKAARVRRMTSFAAGAIFGPNLTRTHFDSEPRGRGRPPGPSGEYKIGGKPVYEAEFQQYSIKQNALNRVLPSEAQSATLNPEYVAYLNAKKAAERGETQTVMTAEGMPMEGQPMTEGTGLPTMGTSMMQTGQQQVEMKQKRAYTPAMPEEVKMAQYMAQQMDNPLAAPNFMKGELKATGGSLLTPIGPSILEAPQVFKGEMRNVTQQNPDAGEIKLSERPQTAPYSDTYLEIELGSGKPVIRKRISEKWMDGRAL